MGTGCLPSTITNYRPDLVDGEKLAAIASDGPVLPASCQNFLQEWREAYVEEKVNVADAEAIAARHCAETGWAGVDEIKDVDIFPVGTVQGHEVRHCWVAFVTQRFRRFRQRKRIIMVSKQSGEILYAGPVRPGCSLFR